MSEPIQTTNKSDTTMVGERRVACGGPSWGRHPKVFLTMVDNEQGIPSHVVCPYCSHTFIFNKNSKVQQITH
jgi:uncharacterized Zn-finger protein